LSSLPGAAHNLYLDFNGHTESSWDGHADVKTPVFNPGTAAITEIWQRVTEKFSPFNINVTTVDPGHNTHGVDLLVAIGGSNNDWLKLKGGAGGISQVGSFILPGLPNVVYVFPADLGNSAKIIAEACAHEAGHAFGLSHQSLYDLAGNKTTEYNPGDADVAPIMGMSYDSARGQWWSGTSTSAMTIQDDLTVLTSTLGLRLSTHGHDFSTASPLVQLGNQLQESGVVRTTNDPDADVFSFQTTGGPVTLQGNVASVGPMLALKFELYQALPGDATQMLASAGMGNVWGATLQTNLAAGRYYLKVLSRHGHYGDVGQYTVSTQFWNALSAPNLTYRVLANQTLTSPAGLLAGFVDPNGRTPSVLQGSVHTTHGTVTLQSNGSFSYQPNAGFRGTDTFTYLITDGVTTSQPATVTLIVGQRPVASDLNYSVNAGGAANGNVVVTDNVVVRNGNPGGVAHLVGQAPRGLTFNADGTFTLVTQRGLPNQTVSFQYYITNPDGTSDIAWVNITIHGNGYVPPPWLTISQPSGGGRPR
jgi:hypothetical protein